MESISAISAWGNVTADDPKNRLSTQGERYSTALFLRSENGYTLIAIRREFTPARA